MSDLKFVEKQVFEELFQMSDGYVLTFTSQTFASFFEDFGINIEDEKYLQCGGSKANKLRAFWKIESNAKVIGVNRELIDYYLLTIESSSGRLNDLVGKARDILHRLEKPSSEEDSTVEKTNTKKAVRQIITSCGYLVLRKLKEESKELKAKNILAHELIKDVRKALEKHSKKLEFFVPGNKDNTTDGTSNEKNLLKWMQELIKSH